jgi:DNA topoisomerase-1
VKSLVIVESPAKAKTINRYLGDSYVVASSIGHVRDLPRSGSAKAKRKPASKNAKVLNDEEKLFRRMGVDPSRNWEASYEILEDKAKVVRDLLKIAKDSDTIYLATDMDREGESIAWHLAKVLDPKAKKLADSKMNFKRVIFNEITRDAINKAFEEPGTIDIDRVRAQQARRFLDRVVGFMLSPLLWSKVARNLSAGRVQSVATRLVVEREAEISAFVPEEYWTLHVTTQDKEARPLGLQVRKHKGKKFRPNNRTDTEKAQNEITSLAPYTLSRRTDKEGSLSPRAPLITSTLQQTASVRLGYGVKKTMFLAQRLYEAGYISYMRTDSTHLSDDAVTACRSFIGDKYGQKYLPKSANAYSSGGSSQEAHEAIRPTRVDVKAEQVRIPRAQRDAERLYELIWRYFVACQMRPMRYNTTSMTVTTGNYELGTSGRVVIFDGFTKVLPPIQNKDKDKNPALPDIKEGAALTLIDSQKTQHFTRPPARYSEASLVKEMEKLGIGRPSTYASVISTIQERGYVTLRDKRMHAEKIGDIVTKRLMENFHDLMDYNFTAGMEASLDKISRGESKWRDVLDDFYKDFVTKLRKAKTDMRANDPLEIQSVNCPKCSRVMCLRTGQTGMFLGCAGYNEAPAERCKHTIDLQVLPPPNLEEEHNDEGAQDADDRKASGSHNTSTSKNMPQQDKRCPACTKTMRPHILDKERCLYLCADTPDCTGQEIEMGEFPTNSYDGPELECDRCSAPMELRSGRFGKYFACTAEQCANTRKMLASGMPAPPKMPPVPMPELRCIKVDDHYLLRDSANGLFLAASQFPRHRETRSPLVEELIPHRDEIDKKYHYLLEAPTKDPEGNKAEVRYSRKTSEQYVCTMINRKPTGWQAFYKDGAWHEKAASPPKRRSK